MEGAGGGDDQSVQTGAEQVVQIAGRFRLWRDLQRFVDGVRHRIRHRGYLDGA
jgi:hypothetical protein